MYFLSDINLISFNRTIGARDKHKRMRRNLLIGGAALLGAGGLTYLKLKSGKKIAPPIESIKEIKISNSSPVKNINNNSELNKIKEIIHQHRTEQQLNSELSKIEELKNKKAIKSNKVKNQRSKIIDEINKNNPYLVNNDSYYVSNKTGKIVQKNRVSKLENRLMKRYQGTALESSIEHLNDQQRLLDKVSDRYRLINAPATRIKDLSKEDKNNYKYLVKRTVAKLKQESRYSKYNKLIKL